MCSRSMSPTYSSGYRRSGAGRWSRAAVNALPSAFTALINGVPLPAAAFRDVPGYALSPSLDLENVLRIAHAINCRLDSALAPA